MKSPKQIKQSEARKKYWAERKSLTNNKGIVKDLTIPKVVILDNNPISIAKYAKEYPENWKNICDYVNSNSFPTLEKLYSDGKLNTPDADNPMVLTKGSGTPDEVRRRAQKANTKSLPSGVQTQTLSDKQNYMKEVPMNVRSPVYVYFEKDVKEAVRGLRNRLHGINKMTSLADIDWDRVLIEFFGGKLI